MNTPISNLVLGKMRKDAERMLALRSPAVDEEWWERMLSIVVELQERRAKGADKLASFNMPLMEPGLNLPIIWTRER
ncbi:hypothetical protein INS61_22230 [Raoultella ornithinolytica]|uniref:Uncharacterized protein n=2 Tax=Klebsiella/Raoultella group TaxID=2890311 RepID=A0A855F8V5_RAOOR|nr:hypothetical protein [Raoultella ornithinolytica]MBZ7756265.1 hypothetical protein [Raoultella ornithinolytica]MCF6656120.1 hypothetical protein [Raoultella ornithinolytica]PIK83642.1 hypothetical protein CFY86_13910 [Raoultella ornithinolytica]